MFFSCKGTAHSSWNECSKSSKWKDLENIILSIKKQHKMLDKIRAAKRTRQSNRVKGILF